MKGMKEKRGAAFEAKVVLETFEDEKTIAQLSSECEVRLDTDTAYLHMNKGFVYLVVIMNRYSKRECVFVLIFW